MRFTIRDLCLFIAGAVVVGFIWLLKINSEGPRIDEQLARQEVAFRSSSSLVAGERARVHGKRTKSEFVSEAPAASVLADGGVITPAAKRQLGLSDEQTIQCQDALRNVRREIIDYATSNLRREESLDQMSEGGVGYIVDANPTLSARLTKDIYKKIADIAGSRAAYLLSNEIGSRYEFLMLGKSDAVIRIYKSETAGEESEVAYEFRDQNTFEYKGGGRSNSKRVSEKLGIALEIDQLERNSP